MKQNYNGVDQVRLGKRVKIKGRKGKEYQQSCNRTLADGEPGHVLETNMQPTEPTIRLTSEAVSQQVIFYPELGRIV